jgi:hypothetical protein
MPSKGVYKLTRKEKSKGRLEGDHALEKNINLKD